MIDKEKIAHDIAISILPDLIKADKLEYFEIHDDGSETFDTFEITNLYYRVYKALLKDL